MSDNANRVEFTREMKKDYTIITPNTVSYTHLACAR